MKAVVLWLIMPVLVAGCQGGDRGARALEAGLIERNTRDSGMYTNALSGDQQFLPVLPHRQDDLKLPQDIAIVVLPPNGKTPSMRSPGSITLVVFSGIGVLSSESGAVNLVPGKAVYVPAETIFSLANTDEEPIRLIRIVVPAEAEVEYLPEAKSPGEPVPAD